MFLKSSMNFLCKKMFLMEKFNTIDIHIKTMCYCNFTINLAPNKCALYFIDPHYYFAYIINMQCMCMCAFNSLKLDFVRKLVPTASLSLFVSLILALSLFFVSFEFVLLIIRSIDLIFLRFKILKLVFVVIIDLPFFVLFSLNLPNHNTLLFIFQTFCDCNTLTFLRSSVFFHQNNFIC